MKLEKRMKIVLAVLLVIFVAGGIVYINRNHQIFKRVLIESGDVIHEADPSKKNIYTSMDNSLIVANSSGLVEVHRSGAIKSNVPANTNDPFVRVGGKYILLADQEGSDAYFIHSGKVTSHIMTNNSIINGFVNEKGYFVLVTAEEGYRSKITVYNSKGEEVYKWKIGEYYIVDVCLSNNGNNLAAVTLSTEGNEISGGIVFVNISKKKVTKLVKLDNTLLSYIRYNGNNVVAIGNEKALCFSAEGKQKWEINYNGKRLQTFASEAKGDIVMSFETGMNTSNLEIYSSGGRLKGTAKLDYEIINLDIRSSLILATGSRTLTQLTHKGIVRTTVNMDNELKYGALCGGRKVFFVAGTKVKVMKP